MTSSLNAANESIVICCPTFLDRLEGVVAINKFDGDGDLLRLQDLIVQVEVRHRQSEHLVIFPCRLIKDGA